MSAEAGGQSGVFVSVARGILKSVKRGKDTAVGVLVVCVKTGLLRVVAAGRERFDNSISFSVSPTTQINNSL